MKSRNSRLLTRFLLWGIGLPALFLLIYYQYENYTGAKQLKEVRATLQEAGESLDFSILKQESVPAEENFCAIPLIAALNDFEQNDESSEVVWTDRENMDRFEAMLLPDTEELRPIYNLEAESGRIELEAWAEYFAQSDDFETGPPDLPPAEQIRNAFSSFDAQYNEILTAANERAEASFQFRVGADVLQTANIDYTPYVQVIGLGKMLVLKGSAAIVSGDPDTAKGCLTILFRFAEACREDRMPISQLVGMTLLSQAHRIVFEGMYSQGWGKDDLIWINDQLGEFDFIEIALNVARGHLAIVPTVIERWKSCGTKEFIDLAVLATSINSEGFNLDNHRDKIWWIRLMPDGWLDKNNALTCRLIHKHYIKPLSDRNLMEAYNQTPIPELADVSKNNFVSAFCMIELKNFTRRMIRSQFISDAVRLAQSIEIYRIENGRFPQSLSELDDTTLTIPGDPFAEQEVGYILVENGFQIYSVGPDGIDDGGQADVPISSFDEPDGDWVWDSRAKEDRRD